MCRETGYLRCSWLMCRTPCCFFLCSKCHNARTQLQIYSRTAKRLTFLQKVRNCVHTVWCSHCGTVSCGLSSSHSVKREDRLSTAVCSSPIPPRGELSYLAPLGSENISAPYFKQCFFQRGYYPPDKHHASQSQDRNNKYFILYIEFCINNKI